MCKASWNNTSKSTYLREIVLNIQPMRPMKLMISPTWHFNKLVGLIIILSEEARKVIGCLGTDYYLIFNCVCLYKLKSVQSMKNWTIPVCSLGFKITSRSWLVLVLNHATQLQPPLRWSSQFELEHNSCLPLNSTPLNLYLPTTLELCDLFF